MAGAAGIGVAASEASDPVVAAGAPVVPAGLPGALVPLGAPEAGALVPPVAPEASAASVGD